MKTFKFEILIVLLLIGTSCVKIDNYDLPDAKIEGRIIDVYTGENLLTTQGGFAIRVWERSWDFQNNNNFESLAVKQDGSYKNTKMFAGTYDMLCYGGAFWPCDTIKGVQITSKGIVQDFEVIPYLQVTDFKCILQKEGFTGNQLLLSCKLKAPRIEGLPKLYELKSFINTTPWCGNGHSIPINEYINSRIEFNRTWEEEMKLTGLSESSKESIIYTLPPLAVKSGYTYWVRIGVAVDDANRNYNYSEIVKVEIP